MIHKMRLVDQAKNLISGSISNGSFCIDLTCGNGLDTYFLAQLVGETGKVFAFDLLEEAVERTRDYLIEKQSLSRCLLFQTCHSGFHSHIPVFHKGKVSAVMMNLGYLPRGKQKIITYPHTTEKALTKAYVWLKKGGVISILAYRGHPGGQEENLAVERLIHTKNWKFQTEYGNKKEDSPVLYLISKI